MTQTTGTSRRIALFAGALLTLILALAGTAGAQTVAYPTAGTISISAAGSGSVISYTITLPDEYPVGSSVLVTGADGATQTVVVPANRVITVTGGTGFGLGATITVNGVSASGTAIFSTAVGPTQVAGVTVTPATATPVPATSVPATSAPVATAVPDFGFGNGTPNQPGPPLAITGSTARIPVILGASLLGIGGLALLAARRRQNVSL